MKNSYKTFTLFLLIALISLSGVFATTQEDLINEARMGVDSWESGVSYTKDTVVSFDGVLYKTLKDGVSSNELNPVTATNLYTAIKDKEVVKLTTLKETKFKDKTLYTGEVSVKGLNLTGTETFVGDRQLVGLADYNPEKFDVSIFTGNDGVKYSIYSYHNETNPSNLNTNRTFIRQNGTYLFDVVSTDGFLKYQTNGFSTQIASIPNMNLDYSDSQSYAIGDYFSSYTEDEVFIDLNDATYVSGDCVSLINLICKMTKDGSDIVTDEYTATHETIVTTDFISFASNSIPLTTLVSVAVNDGVDFVSDSFTLTISAPSDPAVVTNNPTTITSDGATLNGAVTDMGGEASLDYGFEVQLSGNPSWLDVPVGTTSGTLSFQTVITGYVTGSTYDYKAYIDDGVSKTYGAVKSFVPTAIGSNLETGTVAYYKMEDLTDSTSNGFDLTPYNSPTSGLAGIISNSYGLDRSASEYLGSTIDNNWATNDFAVNIWVYPTETSDYNPIFSKRMATGDFSGVVLHRRSDVENNLVFVSLDIGASSISLDSTSGLPANQWSMVTLTRTGSAITLYVNGVAEDTSTSSDSVATTAEVFLGSNRGATSYFGGRIDEVLISNSGLTSDNVEFFYNSGSPTNNQQYPYLLSTPPTQDATINNFNLEVPEAVTIDLDNFFSDFTSYTVTYDDPDSAGEIVLTGTQSDTSSLFTASTNGLTNELTLTSIAEMSALNIEIAVTNADGTITQTPTLTITEPLVPPSQTLALTDFVTAISSTVTIDVDDYFSGFTSYTVAFTNPDDSQAVAISPVNVHTNSKFSLELYDVTNTIDFNGISAMGSIPVTIQVCNDDGCISDSSTLEVSADPLIFPTQEVDIPALSVVEGNGTTSIDLNDYFSNFTSYTLAFTNPDDAQGVAISPPNVHTNDDFSFEIYSNGVLDFNGILPLSAIPYTIQVCNDDGCISDSSTLEVTVYVAPPNEFDEFWAIFGSGSSVVRLIIGLAVILGMAVTAWYYTKSLFLIVFSAIIGLVITVAVGLISIWLVALIVMLSLIPPLYMWLFGRGV